MAAHRYGTGVPDDQEGNAAQVLDETLSRICRGGPAEARSSVTRRDPRAGTRETPLGSVALFRRAFA